MKTKRVEEHLRGIPTADRDCSNGVTPGSRRVVAIEYTDNLFSVTVEYQWDHSRMPWFRRGRDRATGFAQEFWNFEYSRAHKQVYCHNSGSCGGQMETYSVCRFVAPKPPPARLWLVPGIIPVTWKSDKQPKVPVSDRALLRRGYRRIVKPLDIGPLYGFPGTCDPFAVAEECDKLIYCKRCDDWYPDGSWNGPCEHLEWCDECACLVYTDTHQTEDDPDGKSRSHVEGSDSDAD